MSIEFNAQQLQVEALDCEALAETYGTPLYVYSRAQIESNWQAFNQSLSDIEHRICYAVKANSNLAVLSVLVKLGSSFDVVSLGEIERVLRAGGQAKDIVFSGVGKRASEIRAALELGIACFNIESLAELERLNTLATELQTRAAISIRVNPDVDANTHPYISTGLRDNKFGIPAEAVLQCYQMAADMPALDIVGMSCHIGSQLMEIGPYADALDCMLDLVAQLQQAGIALDHLDMGGGMGVRYDDETPLDLDAYRALIIPKVLATGLSLWIEPGRSIVADAGVLLTRVEYLKSNQQKQFCVVDASMSELIRPALYSAYQHIENTNAASTAPSALYDVVGPVCESSDFLGKDRRLRVTAGDLLAVRSAGAYCFGMASNYNSRRRPAEILVDGDRAHVARQRERYEDLWALEQPL